MGEARWLHWEWDNQAQPGYTVVFYFYDEWHRYDYPGYIRWELVYA